MKVATYQQPENDNEASGRAVLNLVKGGFRTITGSIGRDNANAYKVETPAASIGIRGTNYEVMQESLEAFVVGVYEGGVRVENEAGAIDLGFSSNFNYSRVTPLSAPQGLIKPPKILNLAPVFSADQEEEDEQDDEASSEQNQPDSQSETAGASQTSDKGQSIADMETFNASGSEPFNANLASMEVELVDIETQIIEQDQLLDTSLDDFQQDLDQEIDDAIKENEEDQDSGGSNTGWVDFDDLYGDIPISPNANRFASVGLTQQEWNLHQAKNIAALVTPAVLEEVSFRSPGALSPSDFSGTNLSFTISYLARGASTVTNTINLNQNITQISDYATFLNAEFSTYGIPLTASIEQQSSNSYLHIKGTKNDTLFIETVSLSSFSGAAQGKTDFGQLDGLDGVSLYPAYSDEVEIGFGSFDSAGTFVFFEDEDSDVLGTEFQTLARRVYRKALCNINVGVVANCDIQVLDVGGRKNIAWGVWDLDNAHPVTVTNNETGSLVTRSETDGYVYWVAAEPAGANQLVGTMSFQGTLDCTNTGACMGSGVIDDASSSGIDLAYNVSDVSVSFSANFTTNTISSGQLQVTGVSNFAQPTETMEVGWNVSFTGSISDSGFSASSFTASEITGPSQSEFPCTNCVEGEIK